MSISDSKGECENHAYDKAGNWAKRVCNGMEELYRYDKRNRLISYTKGGVDTEFEYDNAGNLLKDDKARYEYDAFNRNTKAETFSGDIQINRYDGEGLRHEMEENGKLFTFIFRGTEIVAEESKEDKIRYIRTGELLASDAESARTYYHYASDEMGSITHVVAGEWKEKGLPDCQCSADGAEERILNRYEYDAWGNLTTCEEKIRNCFKYNGQQYDQVSGQYYLRARYYNPVIGRFTQEDTYRGDGLNLYAYCKNNPVYYVDPSGNICEAAANRIREKVNNGTASNNERKKLAAYDRNEARKRGEVPAGYYQDANGRYHRPNGQFASNKEVGISQSSANNDNVGTRKNKNSNDVKWNNGWRTPDGKFASPEGNQKPGAWAEQDVWNSIKQKEGWDVIEGRVYTKDKTGQVRVYDGVAVTPNGRYIGLEVKSGTAKKTRAQREFDSRIGASNPAIGIGRSEGIKLTHTVTIRR